MIKLLALCFLAMQISSEFCKKGCLSCMKNVSTDTTKECKICDTGYYLKDKECHVTDLPNCLSVSQAGTCLQCKGGYHIDTSTQKCVEVENKIDNCKYYNATGCSSCEKDFIINNSACSKVTTPINKCASYSS